MSDDTVIVVEEITEEVEADAIEQVLETGETVEIRTEE